MPCGRLCAVEISDVALPVSLWLTKSFNATLSLLLLFLVMPVTGGQVSSDSPQLHVPKFMACN